MTRRGFSGTKGVDPAPRAPLAAYDFSAPRLFLDHLLAVGAGLALERAQANYLLNVLRLKAGDAVLVFNGRDGEWRARIGERDRKSAELVVECAPN